MRWTWQTRRCRHRHYKTVHTTVHVTSPALASTPRTHSSAMCTTTNRPSPHLSQPVNSTRFVTFQTYCFTNGVEVSHVDFMTYLGTDIGRSRFSAQLMSRLLIFFHFEGRKSPNIQATSGILHFCPSAFTRSCSDNAI